MSKNLLAASTLATNEPRNDSNAAPSTSPSKLPFEEKLKPTIEYFSALTEEGLAPYQRHEPRGDVFLDLTIENIRFKALLAIDGPYISAEKLYGGVSLGVSAISYVNSEFDRKVGWWVCKYWNQPLMALP